MACVVMFVSTEKKCKGCQAEEGKVFWTKLFDMPSCAIYLCAKEKGFTSCGDCQKRPCSLWTSTREPNVSDEDFEKQIEDRLNNLISNNNKN